MVPLSSKNTICVCFIRLGGRKRCVESEKGAMEQKSLRNTGLEFYQYSNNTIIFFATQCKNDNTVFPRSSAVSGGCELFSVLIRSTIRRYFPGWQQGLA